MPVHLDGAAESALAVQRADELARELRLAVDQALRAGGDLAGLDDAQAIGAETVHALELAAELARDLGITLARADRQAGPDRAQVRQRLDDVQALIGDLDDALALGRDLGRLLERARHTEFARSRATVFARELVYAIARALDNEALGNAATGLPLEPLR
jgi:hypothetical protein